MLGGYDEAAQSHELAELGPLANTPGPLSSMRKGKWSLCERMLAATMRWIN